MNPSLLQRIRLAETEGHYEDKVLPLPEGVQTLLMRYENAKEHFWKIAHMNSKATEEEKRTALNVYMACSNRYWEGRNR